MKKQRKPKAIYYLFDKDGDVYSYSFDKKEMLREMKYFSKRSEFAPFTLEAYVREVKRRKK